MRERQLTIIEETALPNLPMAAQGAETTRNKAQSIGGGMTREVVM
jgi:hypothetical protein